MEGWPRFAGGVFIPDEEGQVPLFMLAPEHLQGSAMDREVFEHELEHLRTWAERRSPAPPSDAGWLRVDSFDGQLPGPSDFGIYLRHQSLDEPRAYAKSTFVALQRVRDGEAPPGTIRGFLVEGLRCTLRALSGLRSAEAAQVMPDGQGTASYQRVRHGKPVQLSVHLANPGTPAQEPFAKPHALMRQYLAVYRALLEALDAHELDLGSLRDDFWAGAQHLLERQNVQRIALGGPPSRLPDQDGWLTPTNAELASARALLSELIASSKAAGTPT